LKFTLSLNPVPNPTKMTRKLLKNKGLISGSRV
jgi:hypothetical protein